MKQLIEVKPGQVWEDKDKRVTARHVVVKAVDPGNGFTSYTRGERGGGTIYRSRTSRFRTAFRLIADVSSGTP